MMIKGTRRGREERCERSIAVMAPLVLCSNHGSHTNACLTSLAAIALLHHTEIQPWLARFRGLMRDRLALGYIRRPLYESVSDGCSFVVREAVETERGLTRYTRNMPRIARGAEREAQ